MPKIGPIKVHASFCYLFFLWCVYLSSEGEYNFGGACFFLGSGYFSPVFGGWEGN